MNYIKLLLITSLIATIAFAQNYEFDDPPNPKIGLVLSGGGALGFAHIGTLQLIDSLNIPIDYIAGTSMGGVAGGLYALGYSGNEIERLSETIDWMEIFTDKSERNLRSHFEKKDDGKYQFSFGFFKGKVTLPSGLIHGQKISMLFSNLTNQFERIEDFDDFQIPYRCVAVDLITGNEVILKNGSISKALRSTMSIPSVFNPVQWGDSLLIDGGLLNNLPVDVVKDMGANIVIAVNVSQAHKNTTDLNSALKILDRTIGIPAIVKSKKNISKSDILIEPDLLDFSRTDFQNRQIRKIIKQGKRAARNALPALNQLLEIYEIPITKENIHDNQIIKNIYIGGNDNIEAKLIYDLLDIHNGDRFNIRKLKSRISSIKHEQYFKSVEYDISQNNDDSIDVILNIIEATTPTIHRISVRGNDTIPFGFIYNLLGINPTDELDIGYINQRIDEIYGLGYFETITYEIEPAKNNSINLIFNIKEASRSSLQLGFTFDETYKFVGMANLVSTKVLVPGLRFESTTRFSGLFDFDAKLFVPIRIKGASLYPYLHTYHKKIPQNIFDFSGGKIAKYNDKSTSWSAGIGIVSAKDWLTEVEYNREYMDVTPDVAQQDTEAFPSWDDELRTIRVTSTLDRLNDVFVPTSGMLLKANFEGSHEKLESDVNYNKFELNLDIFKSIGKRNTFRLFTQYGYSNENLPKYKWFHNGGPNKFIGIEQDELSYYQSSIFGIGHRLRLTENIYVKSVFNIAPNYNGDFYPTDAEAIVGYGVGIKYMTYLGPLEIMYGRGDKITTNSNLEQRDIITLNFGYIID